MPDTDDILESIEEISDKDGLHQIITVAQSKLAEVIAQERKNISRQIAELAASVDLAVDIREKSAPGKKSKSKRYAPTTLPPKYRNPDDPDETWHGRGPRPDWLIKLMDDGRQKEEFLIAS